jgi:hypothetical protein
MILQQKLMNCLTKATEEQTKLIKASNWQIRWAALGNY